MPAPRFRFEFMLLPGESAAEIDTPDRARALMSAWVDPDAVTVERSAVYTFHGLIATAWRQGRVLLAGDAAHQTPPFLGQGMCAGIRDAVNLAWKLDLVIRGTAADALLDTYQAEREPQVRAIVGAAVGFGRVICTTDADTAAARDADMLAARAAGGGRASGTPLPALVEGPLIGDGGGRQVVQPTIDGVRLDDLVGHRFAVITAQADQLDAPGARWWAGQGAALLSADDHGELAAVLEGADASTVVVRPDRYVLAAGPVVEVPASAIGLFSITSSPSR